MGKRGRVRKGRRATTRRERREAALTAAAAAVGAAPPQPTTTAQATTTTAQPVVAPSATAESRPPIDDPAPAATTRRRGRGALLALTALLGLGALALLLGFLVTRPEDTPEAAQPRSSVFAGIPGGEVIPEETPTPEPTAPSTPEPTEAPTPSPAPTAAPTAEPTPAPTATPAPVAVTTQPPAAPAPPPQPTPGFATLSLAGPEDTVLAFYRHVEAERFDQAYALWSDGMKATYPRTENLDQRFDDTASITFHQLHVAEQTGNWATVQANFTEVYESGSSREFIGYWELIRTRDGWLLDAPHY